MYYVASLWRAKPGCLAEAERRGKVCGDVLGRQEGVTSMLEFPVEGTEQVMAVVGYRDKATYERLVKDPNGAFMRAIVEQKMEDVATWEQSWRGEAG